MAEMRRAVPDTLTAPPIEVPARHDEPWPALHAEAARAAGAEAILRGFIDLAVLRHASFAGALVALLAGKLAERDQSLPERGT